MEVEVKMKKKTGETEIVKYASQQKYDTDPHEAESENRRGYSGKAGKCRKQTRIHQSTDSSRH